MEQQVTVMQWYVVTGTAGATVSTPEGVTLCTIPDGGQGSFYAITSTIVTSDDSVSVVKATFKHAPAKLKALGILGGGVSALPAGYLAADFLEATGKQFIDTGLHGLVPNGYVHFKGYTKLENKRGVQGAGYIVVSRRANRSDVYFGTPNEDLQSVFAGYVEAPVPSSPWYDVLLQPGNVNFNGVTFLKADFDFVGGSENSAINPYTLKICSFSDGVKYPESWWQGRVYSVSARLLNGEKKFIPSIDERGVPCMFDKVGKQPFYNSGTGAFIVGMTLEQARKLGKLPAGGGTLKVSLPSNYLEDEGVVNAIAEANAKGWNIEVASTWDASAASATFALRRIWVRKTQAEQGNYVAADGTRWAVESCVAMYNADGSEPDAHGYEPFRSVDAAVAYWELEPYVNPEEEILTEPTTNEYE
jgi:hypothetical protein